MVKQATRKASKKKAHAADFEPTVIALVVAFVAAVSIVLFAVIAVSQF